MPNNFGICEVDSDDSVNMLHLYQFVKNYFSIIMINIRYVDNI